MLAKIGILIFFLWFQMEMAHGQNLYVFSVIETNAAKRPNKILDAERLRAFTTEIAKYGNYTLHWYDFGDSANFTPQVIRKTIETFSPRSSEIDMIWFYYAGKGYCDGPKAWPTLQLNGGDLPVRDLLARFRAKPVRTLLVTADCNNKPSHSSSLFENDERTVSTQQFVSTIVRPTVTNPALTDLPDMTIVATYESLFKAKDLRQIIIMTSANRGQRAYSSLKQGSVWLMAFTHAVSNLIKSQSYGQSPWKYVQENIVQITQSKTKNRQTPLISRQTITCCETESTN
ncbi:hypothetical protein DYU11_08995 [Fibrisoma montanum]|uniref:Peptidase C14 caspase domain-containing protein n=1 Tax=Fibrisoma montanum TaxID=2305895 RepID=A0A418MF51_9BACT|nr:caspase family protein [Fibrisoma montanum]RIV25424.1 hypothetical protein DYU11_08995 [Fibrisoma montanum]